MHLDVATGGELHVALAAGVPPDRLVLHGNNKSEAELRSGPRGRSRAAPSSTASTSSIGSTGSMPPTVGSPRCCSGRRPGSRPTPTSSCGPGRSTPSSASGWRRATSPRRSSGPWRSPAVELVGVHTHIGSQVFVADFFHQAIEVIAPWVRDLDLPELSIGGGLGVPYVVGEERTVDHRVGAHGARRLPWRGDPQPRDGRAGPRHRRPGGSHPVRGRHDQGRPGRAHLRRGRRRHERQPPPGPLRQRLRGVPAPVRRCPPPLHRHGRGQALRVGRHAGARRPAAGRRARSATCWRRRSPAPTATPWGRTTTRSRGPPWCSSAGGDARLVVRRETDDDLLLHDV